MVGAKDYQEGSHCVWGFEIERPNPGARVQRRTGTLGKLDRSPPTDHNKKPPPKNAPPPSCLGFVCLVCCCPDEKRLWFLVFVVCFWWLVGTHKGF